MHRGKRIRAQIVEVQSGDQILVSYQGQLLRVTNQSGKKLKKNQYLDLLVTSESPLQFKIFDDQSGFERTV